MLRADGLVKVLDFGLAKLTEAGSGTSSSETAATRATDITRPGIILGSPAYVAPEQVGGVSATKRSDIWAFGALLYELLTGRRAFPGSDVSRVLAEIVTREPDWELLPSQTPPSIRRLLRRCLAKDPSERLRDIADARLEIEDALSTSREAVTPPRTAAAGASRRTSLALGALGLVGLVVAVTIGTRWIRPPGDGGGAGQRLPLVIMMDSPHPLRVYDKETLAANGTNADVISDILSDLPIRRQKETIGPGWHRDEEIKLFEPDLIIVHYSGFNAEAPPTEPRERLRTLIKFFADTPTKFVIYSRNPDAFVNDNMSRLLADLYAQKPELRQRIRGFGLTDHGPPRWINSSSGAELKLVVKEMLRLK
jgi:hypothetical protein